MQNKLVHAPHAFLKSQICPREECSGRVQDADRVIQTKKKKALHAALQAAKTTSKAQDGTARKGPKQAPNTKVSQAASHTTYALC